MRLVSGIIFAGAALLAPSAEAGAQATSRPSGAARVHFERQILPILSRSCLKCHKESYKTASGRTKKPKADLRLDGKGWILKGGESGVALVPGDPDKSQLFKLISLDPDDDDIMPAKGDPLTKNQIALVRRWIEQGADFGGWVGKSGPSAEVVKKAQAAATPQVLQTGAIKALEELAKGMQPALPRAVKRAAGKKCQVVPVVPGSPLLRVTFVSNESTVRDADLAKLEPLAGHITQLGLAKTRITDVALESIGAMRKLTRLDLNRTKLTDAGLRNLETLRELRYLNLHSTAVTDDGVRVLGKLPKLEALYLWNTKVSDAGVARLRELLPNTKISHKLGVKKVKPDSGNNRRRRRR